MGHLRHPLQGLGNMVGQNDGVQEPEEALGNAVF